MLQIQHLRKSFGTLVAVDDVSFTLERGQLLGLLGPNGAGKTTTVSMIAGLVTPGTGEVLVDHRHRGGLAGAVRSEQPEQLSALEGAMTAALELVGLADRAR